MGQFSTLLDRLSRARLEDPGTQSRLDVLDPRSRVLAAAIWAFLIVSLNQWPVLLAALGLSLLMLVISGTPRGVVLSRLAAMDGLMVFVLVLLPFTVPGTPILELGAFSASAEGLDKALAILLKANIVLLTVLVLVGSLDAVTLGHALGRLKLPDTLVQLLLFTVRYISVIGDEYQRLRTAMRARGFRPRNNRHTYRSLGYLVGMILVRSIERSERILAAMRCRGFQGRFHLLEQRRYARPDALFAGGAILLLVLLLGLERALGS